MILIAFDLAGADWVVTAYYAQEPRMIEVCRSGVSPHTITAETITGVSRDLIQAEDKAIGHVTDEVEIRQLREKHFPEIFEEATIFLPRTMTCRQAGKKTNHGYNYGMGPERFSLENLVPLAEAKKLHYLYTGVAYPGLVTWQNRLKAHMRKGNRTLVNCFDRRFQPMGAVGSELFNQAMSFIPQSTVADITMYGMVNMFADERPFMLKHEPLMQVHDEVLVQYPTSNLEDMARFIVEVAYSPDMLRPVCNYHGVDFQLGVECKVGYDWGARSMIEVPLSNDINAVANELDKILPSLQLAA